MYRGKPKDIYIHIFLPYGKIWQLASEFSFNAIAKIWLQFSNKKRHCAGAHMQRAV